MVLASSQRVRLLETARDILGTEGEACLHEVATRSLGVPLEQITYLQLPDLYTAIERDGPEMVGRRAVAGFVVGLRLLCDDHGVSQLIRDGLDAYIQYLEREGPASIGAPRIAAFVAAARAAVASPAGPMQARILELAKQAFGPAGPRHVRALCERHGRPLEAVDREHLPWLAELLRVESKILGQKRADDLADRVRGLLDELG